MSHSVDDMNNSRRAFLRGSFLTRESREVLGPSPPWHQDKLDPDRCHRCDAPCVTACGPRIIQRHPDGHTFAGMPYINFAESGCTFCGNCARDCPMGLDSTVKQPKIGHVRLDTQSCLAWNDVFCMSCRGQCDHGAVSLDQQRRMQLDEEVCTGCGRCLSICPNQALRFL